MAFWSQTAVEPKRNFRFQVEITNLSDGQSVLWWAKTVSTPSYDVSEVEHNHLDNKYYFPGRVSWTEVSLTLVDPITVDAVKQTNKLILNSGYVIPTSAPNTAARRETISKNKSAGPNGLGDVIISVLQSNGSVIEKWTLRNAFIKSVKFGDLDYANDDLRTIELSFRYDWAECDTTGNPNGGETQFGTT